MSVTKKSMLTAVCLALCVVLPQAFHSIPNAGVIYCPIHIPILLCGLICGWKYGLLCGVAGPLFSSLFTGMPSFVYLPQMMIECGIYGMVAGMDLFPMIKSKWRRYLRLIVAMVCGRVVSGIVRALIFAPGEYSIKLWATGYFLKSLPGIVIQLVVIPAIVSVLVRSALIPGEDDTTGQS